MKKILSCLLAVIIAFSALGVTAFAFDENYKPAYFVSVAPGYESAIVLCDPYEIDEDGNPVVLDMLYLAPHSEFKFKVATVGGYKFDRTTAVKVAPTSYISDIAVGSEDERSYIVYPDEYGVYTIESVDEDLYVYVVNMSTFGLGSIKDLIINLFNAILNFFKWMFNLPDISLGFPNK